MKNINIKQNRRGQGMTEYIVILGIVVAIAIGVILPRLRSGLDTKITSVSTMVAS